MIFYGIVLLIVGIVAWAFYRAMPASHPISTVIMYIGVGVGLVLIAVGLIIVITHGHSVQVDSQHHVLIGAL
jgi:hypothetical protein